MENQLNLDINLPKEKVHSNLGRQLTIRLTITDPKKAEEWLWNMNNNPDLGIHITGSSNGDMFARESILEDTLNELSWELEDKYKDIIDAAFGKIEDCSEKYI